MWMTSVHSLEPQTLGDSRALQPAENLQTRTTPLYTSSDVTMERYVKMVKEHLRKVVSTRQADWGEGVSVFLLLYKASTHESRGTTSASMVFRRGYDYSATWCFRLPHHGKAHDWLCVGFRGWLRDTHRHLKMASNRMKAHYDCQTKPVEFQEGNKVQLQCLNQTRRKLHILQSSWDGPYKVITLINVILYWIQLHPRSKMMAVHLERPALYLEPSQISSFEGAVM
jgi:hypothetical protein